MSQAGRRCPMGCETWPDDDEFDVCPQCDEPTRRCRGVFPLSLEEALSKKRHIAFEAYYAEREAARGGVLPA